MLLGVRLPSLLCQNPWVPDEPPVILPLQVKSPVAPSVVQPVAPGPPARLTDVAVSAPGPRFTIVEVSARLKVEAVEVISPPLTAASPAVVMLPEGAVTVKLAPPTVRLAVVTSRPLVE